MTENRTHSMAGPAQSQINPIAFDATQHTSRGPCAIRPWMVREVALAALAVLVIVTAGCAIHNVSSLSNFLHLNMSVIPPWAYKCLLAAGVVLGFRTLIARPLMVYLVGRFGRKALYPVELEEPRPRDELWSHLKGNFTLKAYDGKKIEGCLLPQIENGIKRKGVKILCLGNGGIYDQQAPDWLAYDAIRKDGYDLVLYHPPGYGSSEGPRTPESDFFALEAVVLHQNQRLQKEAHTEEPQFGQIYLRCQSLGTGVGGAVSAEYPELHLLELVVPEARIEDVAERIATVSIEKLLVAKIIYQNCVGGIFGERFSSFVPSIGRVFQFCLGGVVRDKFGYDNVINMSRIKVGEVVIEEGGADEMMTVGPMKSEAEKIAQAWLDASASDQRIVDVGENRVKGQRVLRAEAYSQGRHFAYYTTVGLNHNEVPFLNV